MKTDELREKYLSFFEARGHRRCPSDVLVPTWDPSVLFTPAGMNPFKDHFLGKVKLDFTRATSSQKCLRTGDIENVGRTAYHHTFFEMLGNFSFGDYFKRDAIHWAWEFLTAKDWLALDSSRLWVSVYLDDDEAATIWHEEIGLPTQRIERMGEDDNFWPAGAPTQGPDGVCGPCSEIYVRNEDGTSVEIWNLVFTQFNRVGSPPNNLRPLPSKNIDTGMGLERAAAVLQNVDTNYHIDILRPIVEAAAEVCEVAYAPASEDGRRLRRIADHVRACTFAIHENVYPGPNREKYVIRRLLRRAVLDGHHLGRREPFLHQLVAVVADQMRGPYPELLETCERVAGAVRHEERAFFDTIDDALRRIAQVFAGMQSGSQVLVDGQIAAELYQTHGVPPELFESLAAERDYAFDWDGFRSAMAEHGEKGKRGPAELFKTGPVENLKRAVKITRFLGYETNESPAVVKGVVSGQELCDRCSACGPDHPLILVLDQTPFYAESGGQVGDHGEILGDAFRVRVTDTQKDGDLHLHHGYLVSGTIHAGAAVTARVDGARRAGIQRAHSATHLLHHALRSRLGQHAQQQGSKVDEDWLRFDFTHQSSVSAEHLERLEREVNERVRRGAPIACRTLPLREAREAGAMMLFGEKYPDPVRMVSIGDYSRELCGGTHLADAKLVEQFELVSEEGISAGTRRIVALTGRKAAENIEHTRTAIADIASRLGCAPTQVVAAVAELMREIRDLKKELSGGARSGEPAASPPAAEPADPPYATIKTSLRDVARGLNVPPFETPERVSALVEERRKLRDQATQLRRSGVMSADTLIEQAEAVGSSALIVAEVPGSNANLLRHLVDQLRTRLTSFAVLLATVAEDGKVVLIAASSADRVKAGLHAGNWVRDAATIVDGGGGGKPDMAQAGGKNPSRLAEALDAARGAARALLAPAS
ncbi:MAG: alanine--tRNA ligase [Planctomycetes bacterium]|nr:alanine--tRNA ligase [Planctomycetota bacterium]